jgi:hypothetical protein
VDCRHRFSARAGTAYAGLRSPELIFQDGVRQLAEGVSIRATARNLGVDKDTVAHWLPRVGRRCQQLLDYFLRDLHLTECQLDELWPFVYKKEKHQVMVEQIHQQPGSIPRSERRTVIVIIAQSTDGLMHAERKPLTGKEFEYLSIARGGKAGEGADHTWGYTTAPDSLDPLHRPAKIAWSSLGIVDLFGAIQGSADRDFIFFEQRAEIVVKQQRLLCIPNFNRPSKRWRRTGRFCRYHSFPARSGSPP